MGRQRGVDEFKAKVKKARTEGRAKISVDLTAGMLEEMDQYIGREGLHAGPSDFVRSAIRAYIDELKYKEFRQREMMVGERK